MAATSGGSALNSPPSRAACRREGGRVVGDGNQPARLHQSARVDARSLPKVPRQLQRGIDTPHQARQPPATPPRRKDVAQEVVLPLTRLHVEVGQLAPQTVAPLAVTLADFLGSDAVVLNVAPPLIRPAQRPVRAPPCCGPAAR